MNAFRARLSWVVVLAAADVACLPMGPPPAGRHLIADRSVSLAAVVPPNGDGLLRILLLRPGDDSDLLNLSVVSLDADGHLSPEVPLVSRIDAVFGVGCDISVATTCRIDANGRAQVEIRDVGSAWVDPVTGDIETINSLAPQPPLGKRTFVAQFQIGNSTQTGILYDADGRSTAISYPPADPRAPGASTQLVGDDFYYRDPQNDLIEIPPSDVPKQLASDVIYFGVWPTPDGPLLALTRTTSDPDVLRSSIQDPSTGMETALPFDAATASMSPDGRWIVHATSSREGWYTNIDAVYTFLERSSGAQDVLQIPGRSGLEWRPGTSEAWLSAVDTDDGSTTTWVVHPGQSRVSLPGVADRGFTPEGKYWFSEGRSSSPNAATEVVEIGEADDPTGPRYPMNPPSTFLGQYWPLPDGRFLITDSTGDANRSDVTLLDPGTGDTQAVGQRGLLAGIGQTRLLGIFHFQESRGDLETFALDTGTTAVLAPEFTVAAFAEPQGNDPVAPGTRVVYQFQARAGSPYDGIWVTACP